jgi:hypothetical protein
MIQITLIILIVLIIACIFAPKGEENTDYEHDIDYDTIIQKGE